MKKYLLAKPFYLVVRAVLGFLFVYAGAIKLADPGAFAQAIDGYGIVSWSMAKNIAYVLPVVEVVTGLGLVLDVRGALGGIVAQLLGFMVVLAYAVSQGLDVDCGCYGSHEPDGTWLSGLWGAIFRDVLMLGACGLIYWQRRAAGFAPRSLVRFFSFRK